MPYPDLSEGDEMIEQQQNDIDGEKRSVGE